MRVLANNLRGAQASYKDVRGPDGERYRVWVATFGQRARERFGLDTLIDGRPAPDVVRVMRNARKRERKLVALADAGAAR